MFDVGFAEVLLLSLVALVVLGPERRPRIARTLGGLTRRARSSWLSLKRIEGVEKVRMTILAPIVLVAFPFAMMVVMNYYWIPDPMSLAFLLPF